MRPAAVRVPGSTSNLGPGFDALGLAVDRAVTARFTPGGAALEVRRAGTLAGLGDGPDLVVDALLGALPPDTELCGALDLDSNIPVARGLGSSAAARVAGWWLAARILGAEPDRGGIFDAVTRSEGHPDNAAPAVFGGLRATVRHGGRLVSAALPISPRVGLAFVDPGVEVRTDDARRVLPDRVALADAAATGGRVALLLYGLATADPELVQAGIADVLHVPYRLALVPGAADALDAGRAAGAWGATLSGSGSGLLAFAAPDDLARVIDATVDALRRAGHPSASGFPLRPDHLGARDGPVVSSGAPRPS